MARTVVEGVVRRSGHPVSGAYVRLLDADRQFTGEERTSGDGSFRFHVSPGDWSIVVFGAGIPRTVHQVTLAAGEVRRLDMDV